MCVCILSFLLFFLSAFILISALLFCIIDVCGKQRTDTNSLSENLFFTLPIMPPQAAQTMHEKCCFCIFPVCISLHSKRIHTFLIPASAFQLMALLCIMQSLGYGKPLLIIILTRNHRWITASAISPGNLWQNAVFHPG